ncbi:MAG TPA: hypothetical protein VGH28_08825 [Polyangiaceae bacterium]
MTPFRDDDVWRQQRATELEADRVELEATLARAEATIRASLRERSLFANVRSRAGVALIALAIAGGFAFVRWSSWHAAQRAHECQ